MAFQTFESMERAPYLDGHLLRLSLEIAEFATKSIAPRARPETDAAARGEARELVRILGDGGWIRHAVPAQFGGESERLSLRALSLIREALAYASPLADAVFAIQGLGSMPISLSGNKIMQDRWLPEVAAGRAMPAFAMTEPEAGSDVAALQTFAKRVDGGFAISGRKWLISNAGIADFYTVFATIDRAAGRRGISCFVVPASSPGLRFLGPQELSEPHPLGEIVLEECFVPTDHLLCEEGAGFKLGMKALDRLRPTVAAAACGMAARALEEALAYSRVRHQFGQPLAELPLVQEKLARMSMELEAAWLLTFRAAHAADRGADRFTLEAAQAKLYATEAAQRIVDDAVQIHGGRGVLVGSVVDRLYRSVRALRIYEGASEVQHLLIARELLRGIG